MFATSSFDACTLAAIRIYYYMQPHILMWGIHCKETDTIFVLKLHSDLLKY